MDQSNSGLFLLIIYFLLAIYLLPVFSNGGSANELTRWATAVSLVENNSFEVSWSKDLIGGKFAGVSKSDDDKIYSTGAPGLALISAPFYAITRVIIGKPRSGNLHTSWFILRFILCTLPLLLLAFWLYGKEADVYSIGALLFATPLLPYSFLYFSHVFAAVLVYFAFRLIYDTRRVFPESCFSAGFLIGFAFFCEYSAITPAIIFGIGLLSTEPHERFRRVLFYTSGIAPFIFALAIYYQVIFGTPLAIFSHVEIAYPTFSNIYRFLISPSHGLFFYSPILLFSVFTFFTSEDRGFRRHKVKIAAILITFLVTVGFAEQNLDGGFGARYLIIIIPMMLDSFFDGDVDEYSSLWRGFLISISVVFCALPLFTYSFAPEILQFPHNSFWQPLLIDSNWFTMTFANTFGASNNIWTILPAMILVLFAIYFVWRDSKFPFKFMVGVFTGFLLVGNYMFLFNLENEIAKPERDKAISEYKKKQF